MFWVGCPPLDDLEVVSKVLGFGELLEPRIDLLLQAARAQMTRGLQGSFEGVLNG